MVVHNKNEGYEREDGYRPGVGTISAIGVVLAVAFMIGRPYLYQWGWLASVSTEKGADQSLTGDPRIGPLMRLVEQRFPADYAKIRDAVRTRAATGDVEQLRNAFSAQMGDFYRRHATDFAQAPDADFRQLIEMHLQLADVFHRSEPKVCARFFMGTLSGNEMLSPENQKLLDDFNLARLTAMANGRDTPAGRPTGPVDAVTGKMLVDAMRVSGAPFNAMEFVEGKRKLEGMTDAMSCETGWHLIRSIRGMPIKQGYPLYAVLYGG